MSKGAKPDTWMPLVIGDYLKDTGRLTTEQHGAYLLLIMDYWVSGPPADDDDELAAITKLDPKTWRRQRVKIERFFRVEDGVWRHKRIDAELAAAQENSDQRAAKASAAAQARWDRERAKLSSEDAASNARSNAKSNARSNAPAMLEGCPAPSPSSIGSVSNETGASPPSDDDLDPLADLRSLPIAKGCWRLAVKVLAEQGRMSDPKARALVGKLKASGLTDDELWQIAEAAFNEQTEDPQAYLVKAAEGVIERRGAGSGFGPSIRDPSPERQRLWMQDLRQGGEWREHERGPKPGQPRCQVSPAIQREFGIEPAAPQPVRGAA